MWTHISRYAEEAGKTILTWAPPAMSSPSKTGRRRMHSLWFRHLSVNVLSVSLSLEHCNLLGERFLREDGRREGSRGQTGRLTRLLFREQTVVTQDWGSLDGF